MGVSTDEQRNWRGPRIAFNEWNNRIESLGVLVFQMSSVRAEEVSCFAVGAEVLQVISVNRKSTPFTRSEFSLLHEFAHLLLRRSGVSDYSTVDTGQTTIPDVEVWCNAVAAATLMPKGRFLTDEANQGKGEGEFQYEDIEKISGRFGVGREAAVRRLMELSVVSRAFYQSKRKEYLQQGLKLDKSKEGDGDEKTFKASPTQNAKSEMGMSIVRMVLESFHNGRMTLSETVGHLNVKVKHFEKLETWG